MNSQMIKLFKPMLAASVENAAVLNFPLLASAKLDGIRAMVINGVLVSRNLKPIPNKFVQQTFGRQELEGFDGELIMGSPVDPAAFRNTTSAVMSHDGEPSVDFHVFDLIHQGADGFAKRQFALEHSLAKAKCGVLLVKQTTINSIAELDAYEAKLLLEGHEGVMLRDKDAAYKYGRSTLKEQGLMKLKRFEDAEAKILGFEVQMRNANEAITNKLGATERSTKKSGMEAKNTLGAIRVVGLNGQFKGVEFSIGSGFNDVERQDVWVNSSKWLGKTIKYKYFPVGAKDAPRFPVYLAPRAKGT